MRIPKDLLYVPTCFSYQVGMSICIMIFIFEFNDKSNHIKKTISSTVNYVTQRLKIQKRWPNMLVKFPKIM